ncbi:hypothetical protein A2899_00215 [Candidatus Amesbacteria bacterium RIFCSPLOWO2_01_FULL_49_25]|uniref:Methenyltetrahydrofolate cyclohydrolase n=1 Tax=Candidatus Amesbacteria bacterium RIFCSPHIGHO2_01_FULL_48_32b TaxID=1797253 RepID=A0A1F4YH66_9BACT|nr:MAG: hypothetical protein A2876_04960 [Candidatus Amesbacteria bacterium RIFCSPHIGHO2_01_FULL_48_32b]OGD07046.1 MAG: hypothetical protein A2899_00215 [Candidatus Amesbacteria bacterium RIFCSPLOWO2_01_FULL_49_25]
MVISGKKLAWEIEEKLRSQVQAATEKLGRRPKLVTIVDPGNLASMTYTNLKAKMAERLGVEFLIYNPSAGRAGFQFTNNSQIIKFINDLNADASVDGIMVQVPYLNSNFLINLINSKKDVDGLREDSPFTPAVVRAVLTILNSQTPNPSNIMIVGSRGFVGRKLLKNLPGAVGMDREDFNPEKLKIADVIISCTGQAGLIKPEMVKEGVFAIDVGYPKGDFDSEVEKKAAFFTPVPGGVGPVTVVMLFVNLLYAVDLGLELGGK